MSTPRVGVVVVVTVTVVGLAAVTTSVTAVWVVAMGLILEWQWW